MTQDIVVVAVKAAAGGTLVVLFALLGEVLKPKWLAGLFSAAPSVAIASLTVTVVSKGDLEASRAAHGMMFGAVAFVVFASVARPLLQRVNAVVASLIACLAWAAAAAAGYLAVLG
jgi:uncharacterized membrane protein (GlpM family)